MVPDSAADLFRSTFGDEPLVVASAPGRVNLIGEHTDYNGGEVLPIAIGRRTSIAMRPNGSGRSVAVSANEEDTGEFTSPHPARAGRWWDYISGLATVTGRTLPAVDLAVAGDVPAGAGLSSSAALEVAAACAYAALAQGNESLKELALQAWRVETTFVGVECGIMDQFASALCSEGAALHIWCDTAETEDVPFGSSVLIFDTAVERSLRSSEYNTRRAECTEALYLLRQANPALDNLASASPDEIDASSLPATLRMRALHVATEARRVQTAVRQLREAGTIAGNLLYESHDSLRDRYECSSPELDWFVDRAARAEGVEGARLTGAGWGGCAIAIGTREALAAAGDQIASEYESAFKRVPRVWLTDASSGARVDQHP
ncbi:MAG TPA: galactokinase [Gemmatimonadaceae bacterium]|nr:galactokinase [Gemmatimonadaceae bacterium]